MNILSFAGHVVSVTTIQLCSSEKAALNGRVGKKISTAMLQFCWLYKTSLWSRSDPQAAARQTLD
jgi:hypothetical protein